MNALDELEAIERATTTVAAITLRHQQAQRRIRRGTWLMYALLVAVLLGPVIGSCVVIFMRQGG